MGSREFIHDLAGEPNGKRPIQRLRCRCRVLLKWILKKYNESACIGLIWLRLWTNGRLLRTQYSNFGFCKMQGIS
jgi:hypothetical protein